LRDDFAGFLALAHEGKRFDAMLVLIAAFGAIAFAPPSGADCRDCCGKSAGCGGVKATKFLRNCGA
jgi:hypothetical protein